MICPILLQLPTWSARLVHLSGSRAAQRIVTSQVNFFFLFQYSPLLLELKITFVLETWPEGSFQLSHQTGCLTRACELKKIYQQSVSVNDNDVRDAIMIPATFILSGTLNSEAIVYCLNSKGSNWPCVLGFLRGQ